MKLFGKAKVEEVKQVSNNPAKPRNVNFDAIYRRLRILEARIAELESVSSTLRRDVSRIDRKQYREAPSPIATLGSVGQSQSEFDKMFGARV